MKLGLISGSHRKSSQSLKVANYIKNKLAYEPNDNVYLLDLADNPLPLWDEGIWNGDKDWENIISPISKELLSCDGFVIICPEWHGMVPSALKNFFLMWSKGGELAHKPALIVTVSSADGGSYPVAELRMSSYKNSRLTYLPEHLIIRYVETVFNENPEENKASAQSYFDERLDYCLLILKEYCLALKVVRSSGVTSLQVFSSGM